ncbi:hypothetical protein OG336_19360 [[Kitasatospora] papulosa]|uniref:hypothetical protein n=1 Tax=[Kitasatospora] papulosa TaxID=1464011 RepID=UPI002E0F4878|nr:hypothetical protein OG336_19360 [[Kitasatospora] papulosa]
MSWIRLKVTTTSGALFELLVQESATPHFEFFIADHPPGWGLLLHSNPRRFTGSGKHVIRRGGFAVVTETSKLWVKIPVCGRTITPMRNNRSRCLYSP